MPITWQEDPTGGECGYEHVGTVDGKEVYRIVANYHNGPWTLWDCRVEGEAGYRGDYLTEQYAKDDAEEYYNGTMKWEE